MMAADVGNGTHAHSRAPIGTGASERCDFLNGRIEHVCEGMQCAQSKCIDKSIMMGVRLLVCESAKHLRK